MCSGKAYSQWRAGVISSNIYTVYASGSYEFSNKIRPEVRLGMYLRDAEPEAQGLVTYHFLEEEKVILYGGLGVILPSGVVLFPIGAIVYPFNDKRIGLVLEPSPAFYDGQIYNLGSLGVQFTIKSKSISTSSE